MLIQALVRRISAEGGFAAVLHRGDSISGAILVSCPDADRKSRLFERMPDFSGGYGLVPVARSSWGDEDQITDYIVRRRNADPDLWVVELDIPNGERFAAAILGDD
ncbi:MAG: hypothetical protein B7Z20_02445 [Sphingobium sp. 32-64-5]|nr:MAG: hypothetical protein B7Z20_02445 [Sphingobium sp. 32-64-5]